MTAETTTGAQTDTAATGAESNNGQSTEQTQPQGGANTTQSTQAQSDQSQGDQGRTEGNQEANKSKGESQDGAPEQYSDFTFPEGVQVDADSLASFQGMARELNLTQDQAQRVIDFQAQREAQAQEAAQQARFDTFDRWLTETKADKEIGGSNFEATKANTARAMNKYATPELKQLLNESGLGDHVEVVRFVSRIGKDLAEDKAEFGHHGGSSEQKTLGQALYPNQGKT
jgi:hypothetical protein